MVLERFHPISGLFVSVGTLWWDSGGTVAKHIEVLKSTKMASASLLDGQVEGALVRSWTQNITERRGVGRLG